MKFKISKEEFGKLPEVLQAEYSEQDGEYVLSVEGGEDTGALKRAKDHEKSRRQKAEEKARELEDSIADLQSQLDQLGDKDKGGDKDKSALEKSWQKKLETKENELNGKIDGLTKQLNSILVDGVADKLARDLSDSPGVILPHIKSRLAVEEVDGKYVTRVKDADGEISALTVDELASEFKSNNDFASIIRGSQGSGSGAGGGQGGSGGSGQPKKPDFATASPKEMAAYLKSQKGAE